MTQPGMEAVEPREVACPNCRQRFETMRRWRMACSECGHEWEEPTVLTTGDKLSSLKTDFFEYIFMGIGWAVLLALVASVAGFFVFVFILIAGRSGPGAAVVIVGIIAILVVWSAIIMRPSREASERLQWWVPTWKGPQQRNK
jgi:hypothetical protein